jgi:SAM-dependent methyltransferase
VLLAHAATGAPSAWVQRFAPLLAPGSRVLDVACGSGRHLRWLAAQGWPVSGVDRDAAALSALSAELPQAELLLADLEATAWPLPGRQFGGVVVTNYLHRPLFPALLGALAEGGVLLYETFADGQQTIGRPARAEFLLQPGELWRLCAGLRVVAFEDGFEAASETSPARFVQRVAAVREAGAAGSTAALPPRYGLPCPAR